MVAGLRIKVFFKALILFFLKAQEINGVKIFRFEGSLYFASCDKFREKTYLRTGVNPRELIRLKEKALAASPPPPNPINTEPIQLELKNIEHSGSAAGINSTSSTGTLKLGSYFHAARK